MFSSRWFNRLNNFGKTKGINRAHLQDRIKTNRYLLDNELSFEEFWLYIDKFDRTIIALSSENSKINEIKYIPINETLDLFKAMKIGFSFGKRKEGAYLKSLI